MKTSISPSTQGRSVATQVQGGQTCATLTPPKLLSWLTANAGISFALGQKLWQQACQDAGQMATPGSNDFFALAIDRLVDLIEGESARRDLASFGFRPWARYQASLMSASSNLIYSCLQLQHRRMRASRTIRWPSFLYASPRQHPASPAVDFQRSTK